jgi:hypothetical protein
MLQAGDFWGNLKVDPQVYHLSIIYSFFLDDINNKIISILVSSVYTFQQQTILGIEHVRC